MTRSASILSMLLLLLPLALGTADDGTITEKNLFANEQYWPYHVALTKPTKGLSAGTRGVLIRLESPMLARIDFGRDGLFEIPVSATDLVEKANGTRLGKVYKGGPNFIFAIAPRLVDARGAQPRQYEFVAATKERVVLAVFADPASPEFAELAKALAPLTNRSGLLTVLFPQGEHQDVDVFQKLVALDWRPSFVYTALSPGYTLSLLPEKTRQPAVQLQTPEGRVLWEGTFASQAVPKLSAALDTALAGRASSL